MKFHLIFFVSFILILFSCNRGKECPPCDNGGTCIDGSCACVGLWTGPNCSQQITPTWIWANRILLTSMPATDDNGAGWDLTSGPDLYIVIRQGGKEVFNTSSQPVINGAAGASWTGQINLEPVPVTIELWDADDFDADDYMGGIVSPLYDSENGFPDEIFFSCGNCVVSFRLEDITYL